MPKATARLQTIEKALKINLDENLYGTFSEIGAGQEVARNFFMAGGAAGTIAKTMSAYDMQVSDAIYGEESNRRYVSQHRVQKMIDREYKLLTKRLQSTRHKDTRFFSFADTVAAKAYNSNRDCHGWMGIKMQLTAGAAPSQVVLHVRMKDDTNNAQQNALGILGVNLIFGVCYYYNQPRKIIEDLANNIDSERIEVDMINFSGPHFNATNNRLMNLHLVTSWLTRSVMFTNNGENTTATDLLYKKNILLLRGSFRPYTNVHHDISTCGKQAFVAEPDINDHNMVNLAEISMAHLATSGKQVDEPDFLGRVDILCKMGFNVQITDHLRYFKVKSYLRQFTNGKIGIVLGVRDLINTFTEHYYNGLKGGILEGLSILFSDETKLYIYPKKGNNNEIITIDNAVVDDKVKYLFRHFKYNQKLIGLSNYNKNLLFINTRAIRDNIKQGADDWQKHIPNEACQHIIKHKLFGYQI